MELYLSEFLNTVPGSASAAIICTVLAQHFTNRQPELLSEISCWTIVSLLVGTGKQAEHDIITISGLRSDATRRPRSRGSRTLVFWIVAVFLATNYWYEVEMGTITSFVSFPTDMVNSLFRSWLAVASIDSNPCDYWERLSVRCRNFIYLWPLAVMAFPKLDLWHKLDCSKLSMPSVRFKSVRTYSLKPVYC